MSAIKAIETLYRGYKFRSRAEARWALFFDMARIEWSYETEGFDLDGVRYLPDFELPKLDVFVEIKGSMISEIDLEKIKRLSVASKKTVITIVGVPGEEKIEGYSNGEQCCSALRIKQCRYGSVGFGPVQSDWSSEIWWSPCASDMCYELNDFTGAPDYSNSTLLQHACFVSRRERFGT